MEWRFLHELYVKMVEYAFMTFQKKTLHKPYFLDCYYYFRAQLKEIIKNIEINMFIEQKIVNHSPLWNEF